MRLPRWAVVLLAFVGFNAGVFLFLKPIYHNPDGVGYFSYLWSIFSEGTLSFESTYQRYHLAMPLARTSQGWLANNWSFGTALLWLPFYEAGRLYVGFVGNGSLSPRDALCLANFGSMVLGALCLGLLYSSLGYLGYSQRRWLILLLTLFGTPLFYYSFSDTTYAHAATAFASGLAIWYWLRPEPWTPLRWGVMGLLVGLAATVRTQEALVLIGPAWSWFGQFKAERERRLELGKSAAWLAAETIEAMGQGEANPTAPNNNSEGRAKNRRVELQITPDPSRVKA